MKLIRWSITRTRLIITAGLECCSRGVILSTKSSACFESVGWKNMSESSIYAWLQSDASSHAVKRRLAVVASNESSYSLDLFVISTRIATVLATTYFKYMYH